MKSQSGYSLTEVMVTGLLLAIGLVGIAGTQLKSLQYNRASYLRTQADVLANDMMEKLRLNPNSARIGEYNMSFSDVDYSLQSDNQNDGKKYSSDWKEEIVGVIPGGQGSVECSSSACIVSLRWKELGIKSSNDWTSLSYATRI